MDVNKLNRLYFAPYLFMKRKLIEKSVRRTTKGYMKGPDPLTAEQKQKIKAFFAPYTDTATLFHSYYAEKTGVFSELFIPTDMYINCIDEYFNKRFEAKTMDNKCYYPTIFAGIPQVDAVAFRMGGFWYDAAGQMINQARLQEILDCEDAVFIKKATDSFGGKGVQYICAENSKLYPAFKNAISELRGDIVVQRPLKQHSALAAINESSVNTIRMISLLSDDGVKIYSTVLRMGVGCAKVDNASSGGMTCGVTEDGKLRRRAHKQNGDSFEIHPTSGLVFDGYEIPGIAEIKALIKKAHPMVPHFRLVSWDFAVNEQGKPVMIEANLCLGELDFHQLNNGPIFGEDTVKILDEVFGRK